MSDKKQINEEELEKANGGINTSLDNIRIRGDYGDEEKDTDPNKSMYEVGMWVELYKGDIHLWTTQEQIIDARFKHGRWEYCFQLQPGIKFWYTAKSIESGTGKWEPHD